MNGFTGICFHQNGDVTFQHFSGEDDVVLWANLRNFIGVVVKNNEGEPIVMYRNNPPHSNKL